MPHAHRSTPTARFRRTIPEVQRAALIVTTILALAGSGTAWSQSTTTTTGAGAADAPAADTSATPPAEGAADRLAPSLLAQLPIRVRVKNGSSFTRTVSIYDQVCERFLHRARQFLPWFAEEYEACVDPEGFAQLTVSMVLTGRRWDFEKVSDGAELQF